MVNTVPQRPRRKLDELQKHANSAETVRMDRPYDQVDSYILEIDI